VVAAEERLGATSLGVDGRHQASRQFTHRAGISWFIVKRSIWAVLTLLVLSVLIFLATHVLPGDPAAAMLGTNATPERLALLREQLGLDRALWVQYGDWIGGIVTGDLGSSLANGRPVADLVGHRIVNSLALIGAATLASVPLAVLLGVRAAMRPGRIVDRATNLSVLVVSAVPEFVVGVVLIAVFATGFAHVLPAVSLIEDGRPLFTQWRAFVLPVAALALVCVPYVTRMTRATMIEALNSEYAHYATVNGIPRHRIGYHHCLPNAMPGIVQATALTVGYIAGSSVIIEAVFNFPGIGLGLVQAVNSRDYPMIQALALFIAGFYVVILLLADLVTVLSVPRIRTRL
jgi:peptide/nickel transport system permease protein